MSKMGSDDAGALQQDRIDRWQPGVPCQHELDQDHNDIVARLYKSGRELYQTFIRDLLDEQALSKPLHRQLQSTYTRYSIWAHDYDVLDGGLDGILQNSHRLRASVIKMLVSICTTLQKACSICLSTERDESKDKSYTTLLQSISTVLEEGIHITLDSPDHSISWSDIRNDDEILPDIIDTLLDEVDYLADLGPRLEEPIPDHHYSDIAIGSASTAISQFGQDLKNISLAAEPCSAGTEEEVSLPHFSTSNKESTEKDEMEEGSRATITASSPKRNAPRADSLTSNFSRSSLGSSRLGTISSIVRETWYCCHCANGPMMVSTNIACSDCGATRCLDCKTESSPDSWK